MGTVGRLETNGVALDGEHLHGEVKLDPRALHDLQQPGGDLEVGSSGDLGQHFVNRHLGTDFIEETGELQTDVTAADDGDLPRDAREIEDRVGIEHALGADSGNGRRGRPRASR